MQQNHPKWERQNNSKMEKKNPAFSDRRSHPGLSERSGRLGCFLQQKWVPGLYVCLRDAEIYLHLISRVLIRQKLQREPVTLLCLSINTLSTHQHIPQDVPTLIYFSVAGGRP